VAERKSFLIRLPVELLDELNRWAKDDLRSVNGQIEFLLRDALRRHRGKELPARRRLSRPKAGVKQEGRSPRGDRPSQFIRVMR
jgi:hypothetical protein